MTGVGARLRVGFVVQRYGTDVAGGSEQLCRALAERLARHCDSEVITTCAQDYMTWKNEFPPGVSESNGVKVLRFPVDHPRNVAKFNALSHRVLNHSCSPKEEEQWMKLQGPYSTPLLNHLECNARAYDAFAFFTYLYGTTYFGLPIVREKAVLIPTAHNEPTIYLSIFDSLFRQARRLLFLTAEEQEFVYRRFCLPEGSGEVAGMGLNSNCLHAAGPLPAELELRLSGFPYILYLGRIDPSKGCPVLIEYFERFLALNSRSPLRLVLAGKPAMKIPAHDRIIATGYLGDPEKAACIRSAMLMVAPSSYESLCIAALEAWALSKPVLANGDCDVLVGQCQRSGGGLWYRNYQEFEACLNLLSNDGVLRASMGASGASFISHNYSWEGAEDRYLRNILGVAA